MSVCTAQGGFFCFFVIFRYPSNMVYQNGSIGSNESVDTGYSPPPPQLDSVSPSPPSFTEDSLPPPPMEFR